MITPSWTNAELSNSSASFLAFEAQPSKIRSLVGTHRGASWRDGIQQLAQCIRNILQKPADSPRTAILCPPGVRPGDPGRQRAAGYCGFEIQATSSPMKVQHQLFLPSAPSLLSPSIVLRRQSCSQPQKPVHLRRSGTKPFGGGQRGEVSGQSKGSACPSGLLRNTRLRCPKEVRAY